MTKVARSHSCLALKRLGLCWLGLLLACSGRPIASQKPIASNEENEPQENLSGKIYINEVDCRGNEWIELVNITDEDVALDGLKVADDLQDTDRAYTFSDGLFVAAQSHLVISAQTRRDDGFQFKMACGEETLFLIDRDQGLMDQVLIGAPISGQTWGRWPDATGEFIPTTPTPGMANQPLPDDSLLFDPTLVHTFQLEIPSESAEALEENSREYVEGKLTFIQADGEASEKMDVGVRLKGRWGSFRPLGEKSAFKIKLDWNGADQTLFGQERLTLNNMVQDASAIHEWTSYTLFRAMGVPAPRVGYAWITVNGEAYGLYTQIETMNEAFLAQHFESTQHLYEGLYGQDLHLDHLYSFEVDEGDANERGDLLALMNNIERAYEEGVYQTLEDQLDWPEILAMMAVELFIGHWDGYGPSANNYFLHSDDDGRFSLLPWGTDQTFDWDMNIHEGNGLLFWLCMDDPLCRSAYDETMQDLIELIKDLMLESEIQSIDQTLQPYFERYSLGEVDRHWHADAVERTLQFLYWRVLEVEELIDCLLGPNPDPDQDGYLCDQDCAPNDESIHPEALDTCEDGIDQDCNGWPDDGPDCPDCIETFSGPHRYLFCYRERTFDEAMEACEEHGAQMVIINHEGEHRWLDENRREIRNDLPFWIGLTDREEEGHFLWWDGTEPTFTGWDSYEPNNAGGYEDCAHFWPWGYRWNDAPCEEEFGVICEDVCPEDQDADGDGYLRCGEDCDDGKSDVSPEQPEICYNDLDDNCDGRQNEECEDE